MPNTRPWVGQTNLQLSDLHVYSLAGLGEHTHAMHTPPPALANGTAHCRGHSGHTALTPRHSASAPHRRREATRAHTVYRAPPRAGPTSPLTTPTKHNRLDGTDRSQRPQAQRAWTERTANNAHIKHNRFGRNGSHPRGPRRPPARESQTAMTPPQPPHL